MVEWEKFISEYKPGFDFLTGWRRRKPPALVVLALTLPSLYVARTLNINLPWPQTFAPYVFFACEFDGAGVGNSMWRPSGQERPF